MTTPARESTVRAILGVVTLAVACVFSWSAEPNSKTKPLSGNESSAELKARRERLHGILDRAKTQEDGIHDTCGELRDIGDASTVRHLIRVLGLFPDVEVEGKPGLGIVCTQGHCVGALEHITGARVGVSYSSWKTWWEKTHPGQSLDVPPNKRVNLTPGAAPSR